MAKRLFYFLCAGLIAFAACKKDDDTEPDDSTTEQLKNTVPEFFAPTKEDVYGQQAPHFVVKAEQPVIRDPWDLEFNPERPDELWVINHSIETIGGSVTIFFKAGSAEQTFEKRTDGNAWHFMSLPSGIAFGDNGNFATSASVYDANHDGGDFFAGPTLWSGDLNVFAKPSGGNGSHMDMLHGSPFTMGIAHEKANAYWVVDGYHGYVVKYDFMADHGPGNDDHADGRIHRYMDVEVHKEKGPDPAAPSHMILDKETGWLYIADNGNKRIIRMNINSGVKKADLPLINEPLAEHWQMGDTEWEVFAETGLTSPAGIELMENRLFVSDFATGEIIAYDIDTREELARINTGQPGILGLKIGPDGKLWYVNKTRSELVRVEPVG